MTYKTLYKTSGYFCFIPIAIIAFFGIGTMMAEGIMFLDKICVKLFNMQNIYYWILAIVWVTALSIYIFSRDARYRGLE